MILEMRDCTKRFKENLVIDDISVTFESGNVYGLQGENGCGKTVILKLLAGYMPCSDGIVLQDGVPLRKKGRYIKNAGILIENVRFLPYLTMMENLELLRDFSPKITRSLVKRWIAYYHLEKFAKTKYKNLSLGTKQKMALIQAFIHDPDVLVLDEPMNALDEESVFLTKNVILQKREQGRLIIMTSHINQDISDLCNVRYLVRYGKISEKSV